MPVWGLTEGNRPGLRPCDRIAGDLRQSCLTHWTFRHDLPGILCSEQLQVSGFGQCSREGDTAHRMNEADTCRKYVLPRLTEAGWDDPPHSLTEQRTFTDGRIIPTGRRVRRGKQKRADYVLCYRRDLPVAIVEAKPDYKAPADGLQQALREGL